MKLILITLIASLLDPISAICHACFDHICYTRKKVFESTQLSGQIAIGRMDNLLHLHYKNMKNTDYTAVIDLNFENLKLRTLPVAYSFARAVDQTTGEVYFSGLTGIYKYNPISGQTERYGHFDKTIWHMQFKKNKLFFSEHQQNGLFYDQGNLTRCISALSSYPLDDFVIDKYEDIYFTSGYLVYRLKKGNAQPELFSNILYSLATDRHDNVYFVETYARTLYKFDYLNDILVESGMFDEGTVVFRLVFDANNDIIYTDAKDDKVYLLYPNYSRCSLTKKLVD